jgi:hypothetical protein
MKLSLPVINTIRFDTDLGLIGKRAGVKNRFECDGYCLDGMAENGQKAYGVGIRIRLNFYVDNTVNEVAGYLSETESTVLNSSTPVEDLPMLNKFASDIFKNIHRNLQDALPELDLTYLEFPDPNKMGYFLSDGLIQLGLYSH